MDLSTLQVTGELDVVCSGGGNLDAFYLGAPTVFSRIAAATPDVTFVRSAGASAGGMMSFELAPKGERQTLEQHLAYGVLVDENRSQFGWLPAAVALQDGHWRQLAAWQTATYAASLSDLDGQVVLATSCLAPLPTLIRISRYTAVDDQATHAFMATGTALETFHGWICTDGGALSGPNRTPLFQDGVRDQVIVDLMATGAPSTLVWSLRPDPWLELLRRGQDAAIEFLTTGQTHRPDVITLCPVGSRVRDNVCRP